MLHSTSMRPKRATRGVDRGLDLRRIEQVGGSEHAVAVFGAEGALQRLARAGRPAPAGAALREGRGHGAAQVAGGAGDHARCAVEFVMSVPPVAWRAW